MADADPWPTWIQDRHRALSERSHGHELRFVEAVLRRIPEIDPSWVTHEFPFQDAAGRNRRVDFVIEHWSLHRPIAIEIDGRIKSDRHPSPAEHDDFVVRQNAMTALGFCLLRFTNAQVARNPAALRKKLSEAIATEQLAAQRLRSRDSVHGGRPMVASENSAAFSVPAIPTTSEPAGDNPQSQGEPAVRATARTRWVWLGVGALVLMVLTAVVLDGIGPSQQTGAADSGVAPASVSTCPDGYPVKGNESSSDQLIYHVPGGQFYDRTNPVRCFRTEADAQSAGFRASLR